MLGALVLLAGLWTAAWHYAADKAETTIAGWREREAKIGRIYACARQTIGGFPFRIDVHCSSPNAEFRSAQPPATLTWKDLHITASVFSPTRLDAHLTGPMTITEPGQSPVITGNWKQANVIVNGLPTAPERVTLAFEEVTFERVAGGASEILFKARSGELVGHIIEGTVVRNPVIEFRLNLAAATLPKQRFVEASNDADVTGQVLSRFAELPIDADVTAVLRGLRNFAPKTWAARFREIQASGGRLDVVRARMQRADVISVTSGQLALTPQGRLEGDLRMTVVQLEKLLADLGLDRVMEKATAPGTQLGAMIDRLPPQFGNLVRQRAAPAVVAGIGIFGEPAELEGKKARTVPLKFANGRVSMGPIPLGSTPPLF
jgi:hypothetical protein